MEKIDEKVYCAKCKIKTNHGILNKHEVIFEEVHIYYAEDTYMISICLGCDTVNFVEKYTDCIMVEYNPSEGSYKQIYDIKVYPSESDEKAKYSTHQVKKFNNLPELLQVLYDEVTIAYDSQLYLLSAIGLRMLVEGICKDLDINDGPMFDQVTGEKKYNNENKEVRSNKLVGQINGMIEKGVIVQSQSRILHEIRELGNQTAHELKQPKGRTILLGIGIIDSILHMIYELDQFSILRR